ncbi:hypothetical protein QFZ75_006951 [Streptomyces sp. V3I8]|uniref:hypothetical protein n=1 Tax=Streptomyces sp. V3I8 TaxID=3042279 RepID=UPI002781CCE6|nr:hypothetical protein [Streptomyces sp. V3I8]MDQ1040535.1 hypothetical protein [Streptomyces sp. V3I8]
MTALTAVNADRAHLLDIPHMLSIPLLGTQPEVCHQLTHQVGLLVPTKAVDHMTVGLSAHRSAYGEA